MNNIFIINGHQTHAFSAGKLNATLTEKAKAFFVENGCDIKFTATEESYDIDEEIGKFKWADLIFFQTPLNWMGQSWSFKKYIDDVFTQGMLGELSNGDGRSAEHPKKNYGLGGKLQGKYMMSVTANAPQEAFNNPDEEFFGGMSEDDLLKPMHLNFKWFGLKQLPTFMAYDVMKNPEVEQDFKRFDKHLMDNFENITI